MNARGGPAPKPAAIGPLRGERIAILGAPRHGALARCLAANGARVVASVGSTTTMLVVSNDQPFGRFYAAHADHWKAEAMQRRGAAIAILPEDEIRRRLALPIAC